MTKKSSIIAALAILMLSACHTPYHMSDISRTRLLIDNRYDATPDATAAAFIIPYKQRVDSIMSPVVGHAATYLEAKRPEGKLSNLMPDILLWGSKKFGETPDFAVYNMGGIRAALAEGDVTYGDVINVAPFENKICFLTLTGEKVVELFSQMASRGGECVSHGVKMIITSEGKFVSATINGKPIDPKAKYRIATLDYVAQGNDQMVAFKDKTDEVSPQEYENNVRFIIIDYFREKESQGIAVNSPIEGRVIVKEIP